MQAVTTQLAKKRDTAPIVRDYVTEVQRRYRALEQGRLAQFEDDPFVAAGQG